MYVCMAEALVYLAIKYIEIFFSVQKKNLCKKISVQQVRESFMKFVNHSWICSETFWLMHSCMYVSMYVCLFVCLYVYIYIYVFMAEALAYLVIQNNRPYHKFVTRFCILTDFFWLIHVCMFVCLFVCMYTSMHVCMAEALANLVIQKKNILS